jgi:hypothetical protein
MAVAYISTTRDDGTNAASAFSGFVTSGTNPVVVLLIGLKHATATVSSVVLTGGITSGTPVEVKTIREVATYLSIWAIPAPTGTGTITINFSTSVLYHSAALLLQGADQTTPCTDGASAHGATNPLTVTCANLTASDASVGIGANTNGGDAPVFTGTAETLNDNGDLINVAGGYKLGTGAVSVLWGVVADDALAALSNARDDPAARAVSRDDGDPGDESPRLGAAGP